MGGAIHGPVGLEYIKKIDEQVGQQCSSVALPQFLLNKTNVDISDLLLCPLSWFQMYPLKPFSNPVSPPLSCTYAYLTF